LSAIALVYVWRQRGSGTTLGAFKKTFLGAQDCEMVCSTRGLGKTLGLSRTFLGAQDCEMIWSTRGLGKILGLLKTFLGAQDCEMTKSTRGLGKSLGLLKTFFLGARDCEMSWSIRDLGETLGLLKSFLGAQASETKWTTMGLLRPTFATPYGLKKDVVASPQPYDMCVKGPRMRIF
jgi:hypothetical protein